MKKINGFKKENIIVGKKIVINNFETKKLSFWKKIIYKIKKIKPKEKYRGQTVLSEEGIKVYNKKGELMFSAGEFKD